MLHGLIYLLIFVILVLVHCALLLCDWIFRYSLSLSNLYRSLAASLRSVLSILLLLFIYVFIMALLGIELFAGKNRLRRRSRATFDTFWQALLTVCQVFRASTALIALSMLLLLLILFNVIHFCSFILNFINYESLIGLDFFLIWK